MSRSPHRLIAAPASCIAALLRRRRRCSTGCVPAVVAVGVGDGAIVATDRRSTGAQVDDETIELKVATTAGSHWGNDVHLNVTSYNGIVLLTGEAPSTVVQDEIAQDREDDRTACASCRTRW